MRTTIITHLPITASLAIAALGACDPAAPATPTWAADIMPVVAANCARCHGYPSIAGAPGGFRLDRYESTITDDGRLIRGAATVALYMATRVEAETMPPRFPLEGHQIDLLTHWAALGEVGVSPPKGDPRPGNRPPELTVKNTSVEGDSRFITFDIRDPDGDFVFGQLRAGKDAASATSFTTSIHAGRNNVVWDTRLLEAGMYQLVADLDDGSGETTADLGWFEVKRAGNAPPHVAILTPIGDDILSDRDAPFAIQVKLQDRDLPIGSKLEVTIKALRVGDAAENAVLVAPPVEADNCFDKPDPCSLTVPWDTKGIAESFQWTLQVSVSDRVGGTGFATTPPLVISHATTTETWDSIKSIFNKCTDCHAGAQVPGIPYDFTNYSTASDPTAQNSGVYEVRSKIFRRAIREENMPPTSQRILSKSATWDLDTEERERLGTWLLAGAPEK